MHIGSNTNGQRKIRVNVVSPSLTATKLDIMTGVARQELVFNQFNVAHNPGYPVQNHALPRMANSLGTSPEGVGV